MEGHTDRQKQMESNCCVIWEETTQFWGLLTSPTPLSPSPSVFPSFYNCCIAATFEFLLLPHQFLSHCGLDAVRKPLLTTTDYSSNCHRLASPRAPSVLRQTVSDSVECDRAADPWHFQTYLERPRKQTEKVACWPH